MRPDWTAGLLAAGLTLVACSPEEPPQEAGAGAPAAATGVAEADIPAAQDVPAVKPAPAGTPAAEPEPPTDPDPQVGVELPAPPVRVPENPPAP